MLLANFHLLFGPNAGLHFSDVCFLEQVHAQSALADAATYGEWELAVEERFVEGEVFPLCAAAYFKLAAERFGAYAYSH